MAITKQTTVDQIEVTDNGTVQVRTITRITENGLELASSLHRHTIAPDADYSNEDAKVQAVCAAVRAGR